MIYAFYHMDTGNFFNIFQSYISIYIDNIAENEGVIVTDNANLKVGLDYRFINDQICVKPCATLSVTKTEISADGIDETELSILMADCLDNEVFPEVEIKIRPGGNAFTIPLTNNVGSIKFSCRVAGKYTLEIPDDRFRKNSIEVVVNET